jgi:hypothetical protein
MCHANNDNTNNTNDEIEIEQQNIIMDSGFQSRPESGTGVVEESVKKRIYQQAVDINQRTVRCPRLQRVHESVSKIFGIDDPPAGFGLVYPKCYYLEQKKPQPMQPLKVSIVEK